MVVFACTDGQCFVPNDKIHCSSTLSLLCEKTGTPDELPVPFSVVSIRNIFCLAEPLPVEDRVFAILRECGHEILNACDHLEVASVLNWLLRGLAIQVGQTWTWAIGGKDVAESVLNRNLAIRLFAEYPNHIPHVCALLDNAPFAQEVVERNAGWFGLESIQRPQTGGSWVSRARIALASRCYICLSASESCISAPWFSPFATTVCVKHLHRCTNDKLPRMHRLIIDKFVSKANFKDIHGECKNPDVYLRGLPWPDMLGSRQLSAISKLHARLTMTTAVADSIREQPADDVSKCSESTRVKRIKLDDDDDSRLAQLLDEYPDAPVCNPLLQSYIHTGAFAHSEENLQDFVKNVKVRIWLDTVQAELSGLATPNQGVSWHPQRLPEDHLISDAVKRSAALYIDTWREIEEKARAVVGDPGAMLRHARKVELCADLKELGLRLREDSKLCEQYIAGTLKPPMTSRKVSERMAQMRWLFEYTDYAQRRDEEFEERVRARIDDYSYDDSGSDSEDYESDDSDGFIWGKSRDYNYRPRGPWIDRKEVYDEVCLACAYVEACVSDEKSAIARARKVYEEADKHMKNVNLNEEWIPVLDTWLRCESCKGSQDNGVPKIVEKHRYWFTRRLDPVADN